MNERMTSEQQVLLSLLKGEEILIPKGFLPKHFFLLLRRHKLLPLAEQLLGFIPEQNADMWKVQLTNWTARSLMFSQELTRINALLIAQNIPVLNVKGPALSEQLYRSSNQRFFTDLDIIIEPKNLDKAIHLLEGEGYGIADDYVCNSKSAKQHFKFNNDVVLIKPNSGVQIELHVGINIEQLFPKKYEEEFLSHREVFVLNGLELSILSPEYHFLYLCLHGAKHMFFRLSWLRDIAAFLTRVPLDHVKIIRLSKDFDLEKVLLLSLRLIEDYFDVRIPSEYNHFLSRSKSRDMMRLNKRIILGPGELIYENYAQLKAKENQIAGVDQVSLSLLIVQLRYLVGLRKGLFRKLSFLAYQIKKRGKF